MCVSGHDLLKATADYQSYLIINRGSCDIDALWVRCGKGEKVCVCVYSREDGDGGSTSSATMSGVPAETPGYHWILSLWPALSRLLHFIFHSLHYSNNSHPILEKKLTIEGSGQKGKSLMRSEKQKTLVTRHTINHMTDRVTNKKKTQSFLFFLQGCLLVMIESCLYNCVCVCVLLQHSRGGMTASSSSPWPIIH